tara:strand:+ start:78 stop:296 length:219 start_codon:yes stop_codon:yes gene_type:complete
MEDLELQDIDEIKERPFQDRIAVEDINDGEEIDTIVNGKLRTYIRRGSVVYYLEWSRVTEGPSGSGRNWEDL